MKFAPKIPAKSTDFSANLSRKILWNLTFFSWPIRSPALMTAMVYQILSTTVEPPITATSPQPPPLYNGHFFWLTVHTFTLVSTSLRWLLCSVPKVAIGERLNCILYGIVQCMEISLKWKNNIIRGTICRCPLRVSWLQCSEGLEMYSLGFVWSTLSLPVMLTLGRCWFKIDSKPSNTFCLHVSLGKGEELKFPTVQKDDEFLGVAVQLPCFPYF